VPGDHAAYLKQRDFVVDWEDQFDEAERALLTRYGRWLEALVSGAISPLTPEQTRFLEVARGEREPDTPFERAWAKLRDLRTGVVRQARTDVDALFAHLAEARQAARALAEEYDSKKEEIMAALRPQLEALEAEYAPRQRDLAGDVEEGEARLKAAVLLQGASVQRGDIRVVYTRGRVTWDRKGLEQYIELHPEAAQYRKVGPPIASIRYNKAEPTEP
jgi:uncharacterized protein YifE (UPF0438 family)